MTSTGLDYDLKNFVSGGGITPPDNVNSDDIPLDRYLKRHGGGDDAIPPDSDLCVIDPSERTLVKLPGYPVHEHKKYMWQAALQWKC
jgi:hypothetical protein